MAKRLLDNLEIVGKSYEVLLLDDMGDKLGEHDSTQQVITLLASQHQEAIRDTLLHEVIHAVSDAMNLDLREKQVASLATGLVQIFRNNPHFLQFIATRPKGRKR